MAAMTAPARTSAQHQSLLHFVGKGQWSDEKVLSKVGELVLPGIERHGAIRAWIVDDTSFPKQGRHSIGVARQYCGQLSKQDNCQTAVSLSLANDFASLPVAHRLYVDLGRGESFAFLGFDFRRIRSRRAGCSTRRTTMCRWRRWRRSLRPG